MRSLWSMLAVILIATASQGQHLSSADKKIVDAARSRYYNLELQGFQSMSCSVAFDFSTLPPLFSSDAATLALLKQVAFELSLDRKSAVVRYAFPAGAPQDLKGRAAQPTGLLKSLVEGVFQTWLSKGLNGPIPPFDAEIETVQVEDPGYVFNLRVPGAPVEVHLDKEFLVKDIVSAHGKVHEQPVYTPSTQGLVFTGNDANDQSQPDSPTRVRYELATTELDGLKLPAAVRIRVNDNIDVRYALTTCTVKKGIVLKVAPPPSLPH